LQQNMKHTITSSKSSANSSKARWVRISTLLKPNGLYESRGGSTLVFTAFFSLIRIKKQSLVPEAGIEPARLF
ncbi:hypothetical protein, partial [Polynucleobacter sp.]|uniref:hypothetical protein n=1 Tax=Polynucleobacter sp. TaxID=2029855 RepID=UPI0037C9C923